MFSFNYAAGASAFSVWGVWIVVFISLFGLNEIVRRWKYAGFFTFFILPIGISILWFTLLKDTIYTDWHSILRWRNISR